MKRLCIGGQLFIDRINEDNQEVLSDFETVKGNEIQNYAFDSIYSTDDKINQMKTIRNKGVLDQVCFDQEDDIIDNIIKSMNITNNFKNYTKGKKHLKTDSNALSVN